MIYEKVRKKYSLFFTLVLILFVSGCVSSPIGEQGELEILVSDQDITNFDFLNVELSEIRVFRADTDFETFQPTVDSFDLTQLQGDAALSLINATLEAGKYTKIEFHVNGTEGEVSGESVAVIVPSNKLMINKNFDIEPNRSVSFVFDINVVQRGQTNEYNLLPVISESGVIGKDIAEIRRVNPEQAMAHRPSQPPDQDGHHEPPEESGPLPSTGQATGKFSLFVTDAPADIGDFSELIVEISNVKIHKTEGGKWLEFSPNISSFDLTTLVDGNILQILEVDLDEGMYTQVVLVVDSASGLVDNESISVKIPSDTLKIIKPFRISSGDEVEFLFDINVVKRGQTNNYNLLPVIGKSGIFSSDNGNESICGNDICEIGEDNVTCPADCLINQTVCGNNIIEMGEDCDDTNLNNMTCSNFNFTGGNLSCVSCSFDTSECFTNECGDGSCQEGEDFFSCPYDCNLTCTTDINCGDTCFGNVSYTNGTCTTGSCEFLTIPCVTGCLNNTCVSPL